MILSDYSARKRHDMLWEALYTVLQGLNDTAGTSDVAALLRMQMRFQPSELPLVLTWLKKVAPVVPEASQTGAVVKAYGRYGRRWIWSPRPSGLTPAAAIDASDW